MKIWNICLYLAIFSLACSCMVSLVPFIFPDQAEVIAQAIPVAGDLTEAVNDFTNTINNEDGTANFLGLALETIVSGLMVVVTFFKAAIFALPQIVGALNLGVGAMLIVGVLQTILYVMLVISIIQLITGRYFINVE